MIYLEVDFWKSKLSLNFDEYCFIPFISLIFHFFLVEGRNYLLPGFELGPAIVRIADAN